MVAGADDRLFHPPVQGGHHATGPHEQAHRETDRQADRDILEPSFGGGQSRGEQQREHDDDRDAEACLPHGQREGPGRVGRDHEDDRQQHPPHRGVGSDKFDQSGSDQDAGGGSHQRLDRRAAGAQRIESQCGQRSQHDPETMGQLQRLGERDAEGQGDGGPQGAAEPGRVPGEVPLDPIPDSLPLPIEFLIQGWIHEVVDHLAVSHVGARQFGADGRQP